MPEMGWCKGIGGSQRLLRIRVLIALGVALCACREQQRTPVLYLIPEGFVGWLEIDYDQAGGVPPEREGRYEVMRLPAAGLLATTARQESGWASDEYDYVDAGGNRRKLPVTAGGRGGMVWAEHSGEANGGPNFERIFIGTEAQYWASADDPRFWPPKSTWPNGRRPAVAQP
jgi:hypothetical protein